MRDYLVRLWRDTEFLDYLGALSLLVALAYIAFLLIRVWYSITKDTPWWKRNKENFLTELSGWTVAIILSISAMIWRDSLDANFYGIAALNTGVALILRFLCPVIWVSSIWLPWSRHGEENPDVPMSLLQNHRIIAALNRGIVAATITSAGLVSGKAQPDWLGEWWVIIILTSFACVTVIKIESTMQPIEVWHKLTKNKYRQRN